VEVHVQVERGAEALDQRHCAGLARRPCKTGTPEDVTLDRPVCDPEHARQHGRIAREQEAQRKRQRQHPLPHRFSRQYFLCQESRRLRHSPRAAARTDPPPLAAECHQLLGVAGLALHAQEAVLESSASQVVLELALNVPRHRPFGRLARGEKRRIVRFHKRVEQRLLGPVPRVARRIDEWRRPP
jgi:hypothetical protein